MVRSERIARRGRNADIFAAARARAGALSVGDGLDRAETAAGTELFGGQGQRLALRRLLAACQPFVQPAGKGRQDHHDENVDQRRGHVDLEGVLVTELEPEELDQAAG